MIIICIAILKNMGININDCSVSNSLLTDRYLYNKVANCICGHRKLLLSYSGGLDSTVLLDILATLIKCPNPFLRLTDPFFLRAIYIDHGFNINSSNWADHCAKQCAMRNIPFHIIRINCDLFYKKSSNIEEMARILRYQALCNCLNSKEILLTAHHIDDQVETVLLALKRGSGPTGLSGIHKNIILNNNHRLLRPFLECSQVQIKEYAYRKKLIWIEDNTNTDIRFDRNFLRINIIPLLKKRWPSFNIVVARTAQLCRNQENLLKEFLLESLNTLIDSDGSLFYDPLLKYSQVKRNALLRCWLNNFFINMPSYQLLNRIWQEVILCKSDANPILRLGQYICRRFHKKLYILSIDMASTMHSLSISWNILNNTISLPLKLGLLISQKLTININEYYSDKLWKSYTNLNILLDIFINHFKIPGKILTDCVVRSPTINEKVSIRFGKIDGLLYIVNRNRGRKLKKIWQELNIPPWLRDKIPLLFYNNTLIAAIGIFITNDGKATNFFNTTHNKCTVWRIFWIQRESYYITFKYSVHCVLR